ncbi:hypothetical protein ACF0H5_016550 [Mactra antiquata]
MSLSEMKIKEIIKAKYGITVDSLQRLQGYEDINVHFTTRDNIPGRKKISQTDFILKIIADASSAPIVELQHKLMLYLDANGIRTNTPVNTLQNDTTFTTIVQQDDASDKEILCYVLSYLPGKTMFDVDNPACVLEDIGQLAGKVDTLLKDFDDGNNYVFNTLWELTRVTEIRDLLIKYCDDEIQSLGQDIISTYLKEVKPNLNNFQKGLIHGDLNNCNIILKSSIDPHMTDSPYTVSGLIDYGDICYSYYIYEIAILIGDIMSSKLSQDVSPLEAARLILKGYIKKFPLQYNELHCLRIIICVRLLIYFVLSAVSLHENPDNQYAGLDRDGYMAVCKYLWNMDDEVFRQSVLV